MTTSLLAEWDLGFGHEPSTDFDFEPEDTDAAPTARPQQWLTTSLVGAVVAAAAVLGFVLGAAWR